MFNFFSRKKVAPHIFYKTDIHSHLAPGIDDGQREAASAADLVERMKSWGLEHLIVTPHVTQDKFENTPKIINHAFSKLTAAVKEKGTDIELSRSAEYRLDGFFQEQLEEGNVTPMPNGFLLVENSFIQEAWDLDNVLFDLKLKGYRPILAHPERYMYYHFKRERYGQLHNAGTYFQVNLLSLAGHYGKAEKKMAEYLIDQNLVDFLGTDMHNHTHCQAIEDYLRSKDYRRHAEKLEGRILNDTAFT